MKSRARCAMSWILALSLIVGMVSAAGANRVLREFEAFLDDLPPDTCWGSIRAQHPDDVTWMQRLHHTAKLEPDIETRLRLRDAAISLFRRHGRFAPRAISDAMLADARASGDFDWLLRALEHGLEGTARAHSDIVIVQLYDELFALLQYASSERIPDRDERLATLEDDYACWLFEYAMSSGLHTTIAEELHAATLDDVIRRYEALLERTAPAKQVAGKYHQKLGAMYESRNELEEAALRHRAGAAVTIAVCNELLAGIAERSAEALHIYMGLAEAYETLDRFDEAAAVYWLGYERAMEMPDAWQFNASRFHAAYLAATLGKDTPEYFDACSRFVLEHPPDAGFSQLLLQLVGAMIARDQYNTSLPLLDCLAEIDENRLSQLRTGKAAMLVGSLDKAAILVALARSALGSEHGLDFLEADKQHAIPGDRKTLAKRWQSGVDRVMDWAMSDEFRPESSQPRPGHAFSGHGSNGTNRPPKSSGSHTAGLVAFGLVAAVAAEMLYAARHH